MRTLLPIVLFAVLGYAGWFYWQEYTDEPLQEKLLLHTASELKSVTITAFGEEPFQMIRAEGTGSWTVKQGIMELHDQSDKVERLLDALENLKTDSVMRRFSDKGLAVLDLAGGNRPERIELSFPDTGPVLGRIPATGDVFALNSSAAKSLPNLLRLATYRQRKLLRIPPEKIDSIVVTYHDSLLWSLDTGEVVGLAKTFIAPASAPQADYFDEIMDREKYFATLHLYAGGAPHQITVYQDTLWPKPFVLVGDDFPRQYWAVDSVR